MKRLFAVVAAAVAIGPLVALAPAQPAHSEEIIRVCITITEKFVGFNINGTPVGVRIPTIERTCAGV